MKNIPIIAKFLTIIGALAVFVIAATVFATGKMQQINSGYIALAAHEEAAAVSATRVSRTLWSSRYAVAELVLADTEDARRVAKASLDKSRGETVSFSQDAMKGMPDDAELPELKSAAVAVLDVDCANVVKMGSAAADAPARTAAQAAFLRECSPAFPAVIKRMFAKSGSLRAAADTKRDALSATTRQTVLLTFGLVLGGLGLVVAGAFFAVRLWISSPMSALERVMRRLAGGELDAQVAGVERRDELGRMAKAVQVFKEAGIDKVRLEGVAAATRKAADEHGAKTRADAERLRAMADAVVAEVGGALSALAAGDLTHRFRAEVPAEVANMRSLKENLNSATEQLQQALSLVAANSGRIRTGIGEIGHAADDLSRRTEQQATSLEETAAALGEITATVKQTAAGASVATETVGRAKADAERSGEVVRKAVEAMDEIAVSAREISQIIGVIDEIAFQINLLALNAGVEAARAGDAGRGFAVVATEVRALAQRSADAAKDIKGLISVSSRQVERGVSLVGETGQALARIVSQVGEISGVVGDMASGAEKQASALQEVNSAVTQMDQVTQQNAAMTEELTAASHALSGEVQELAKLVGTFRLTGAGAAASPSGMPGRGGSARRPAAARREDSLVGSS